MNDLLGRCVCVVCSIDRLLSFELKMLIGVVVCSVVVLDGFVIVRWVVGW